MLAYDWNFLGLSTETKPTAGEKVVDGSTFYECDTSLFYIYYNGEWYQQTFVTEDGINFWIYKTLMKKMFGKLFDSNISKGKVIRPTTGTEIEFTTTQIAQISNLTGYGDTFQQTYTGANLFNVNTITPPSDATINADGSITCVYDNTSGTSTHFINLYPANLDLQTSTTYAAFAEIISLTGGGTLAVISGSSSASQFTNNKTFNLAEYQTGDIIKTTDTTKADFSGTNAGTRTYVGVQAGLSLNLTFRMSVIADTTVTPQDFVYQPYVGGIPSPNPSYPQEIKTVTGEQTVEVRGKNMFNQNQTYNGFINDSGVLVPNANWQFSDFILVSPNTEYVLSCARKEGTTGSLQLRYASYESDDEASFIEIYALNDVSELTYTTPANCKYIRVGYRKDRQTDIQLEPGSTATAYEPYVGQTYTIDLGSIELCKIGNYQDYIYNKAGNWYIHKEVGITTDSIGSTGITIDDMALDGSIYSYCGGTVSGSTVTYVSALTTQNTIYYQLASTTETKITDNTLISSLNSLLNYIFPVGEHQIVITADTLPMALKLIITEKE